MMLPESAPPDEGPSLWIAFLALCCLVGVTMVLIAWASMP